MNPGARIEKAIEAMRNEAMQAVADAAIHRQAVPLAEADLTKVDKQINMFNNECAGMCGV